MRSSAREDEVGSAFGVVRQQTVPLRVLTDNSHPVGFNILHGQKNAVFTQRPLTRDHGTHFPTFNETALTLEGEAVFDLLHSLNAVPIKPLVPFVVTFEDVAPRVWEDPRHEMMREHLLNQLLSPNCLRLIAMSQYALRVFERQHAADSR